jgi:hypothetical protein
MPYFSESGYYNPSLPGIGARGNLGLAGLADFGARFAVEIIGLPKDANLAVPNTLEWKAWDGTLQGVARRIASPVRPFQPAGRFDAIDPLERDSATGNRVAYYEVLLASEYMMDTILVPLYPAFSPRNDNAIPDPAATVSARVYLAPVSADASASRAAKVPRFSGVHIPAPTPLFTLTK